MESNRLPRFKRAAAVAPMQVTGRDREILRLIHRHRFLRSHQIIALLGGSTQQISRRLKLLYHHGYVERPRAQLEYYHQGGSKQMVYGLADKAGMLLNQEAGEVTRPVSWSENNRAVGRIFLEHALLVSEVMVSLELACRKHDGVRLLYEDQLDLPADRHPSQWRVKTEDGITLGLIPDRVFALEYENQNGEPERAYFFLEADRGTMPVMRRTLAQSSFYRKLLAYEATWRQKIHQRHLGIHRFRVLTVTTGAARVKSIIEACSKLKRGHRLFLFADRDALRGDMLTLPWQSGKAGETGTLLD